MTGYPLGYEVSQGIQRFRVVSFTLSNINIYLFMSMI